MRETGRVKWVSGILILFALLVISGCSAAPARLQETAEQLAPTMQAAAADLAAIEESGGEETSEVHDEAVEVHEDACDPADLPLPQQAEATVRFVNASGHEMTVRWRDDTQSPPQLVEYGVVADGEHLDQESFTGHVWVLEDHDRLTKEYVVTADTQQCATLHHWTYEGETGPDNWAKLRDQFETCKAGIRQSPVELKSAKTSDLKNIEFEYGDAPVKLLNNGHTIQADALTNNQIVLSGVTYPLVQFHFHAPSEHVEAGVQYPLEMHLVHRLDTGELAVVGVFIAEGAENSAFAPVWDHLAMAASPAVDTGATINVAQLLPVDHQFYAYVGSLTTPACSEGVKWFVMNEPIKMSAEQIAAFTDIFAGNNRPLQKLEAREVVLDATP